MSTTIICAVHQDKEPIFIGECRNAFRGAMYVWNDIATRYFDLECYPMFDSEMQSRVWNAGNEKPLTGAELIVLASTMDKAIVKKSDVDPLLEAFKEYGSQHEHSSLSEQADLIDKNRNEIPDGYDLAWIQTSVTGGWFRTWDEETEQCVCNLTDAFDLIEQSQGE